LGVHSVINNDCNAKQVERQIGSAVPDLEGTLLHTDPTMWYVVLTVHTTSLVLKGNDGDDEIGYCLY
jgi:hypothetical protein